MLLIHKEELKEAVNATIGQLYFTNRSAHWSTPVIGNNRRSGARNLVDSAELPAAVIGRMFPEALGKAYYFSNTHLFC